MTAIDISTAPIAAALRDAASTGRIVEPGASGCDAASADWNGAIDRLPAAVAFAADAEDVAAAIRAARCAAAVHDPRRRPAERRCRIASALGCTRSSATATPPVAARGPAISSTGVGRMSRRILPHPVARRHP